jgi:hypothetical protein
MQNADISFLTIANVYPRSKKVEQRIINLLKKQH